MDHALAGLLRALAHEEVRYLVVGGLAKRLHGHTDPPADRTLWYDVDGDGPRRLYRALERLGAPLDGVSESDLADVDYEYVYGEDAGEVRLVGGCGNVTFADAWAGRVESQAGEIAIRVISRDALRACEAFDRSR